ncbi:SUMF1/EgtB/PvdO family nonheme iron enzyme [Aerosakkonema funiforme]|uniref:SUMF1/EgtB/PvdO family nonheme iron enzyme n=1 Tax=Aerosakkonema funiforme TaxID=1246630 RepID=UPI0035B81A5D
MSNCPICQSEYLESKVNFCSTCGWDLTPYPLTFAGQIPEVFLEKERAKLAWAKQIWSRFLDIQDKLNEEKAFVQAQLTEVLTKLNQVGQVPAQQLTDSISNLTAQLAQVQQQLTEAKEERKQLLIQLAEIPELEKVRQERADLVIQLTQAKTEIARLQAELDKVTPPKLNPENHREFSFEVVTVDSQGRENSRQRQTAWELIQQLPGGIILEMVAIPGGEFWMGSPDTELGRRDSESPLHLVTISPFYMGRFPVTQAQWQAVAGLPKVNRDLNQNPSYFKGSSLPVENVSWYDSVEFCDRLTQYTQRPYRLPSEAEWEYACRAGTTTPFHFGETINTNLVNYNGNYIYGAGAKGEDRQKTTPVGSFQIANTFGLSDMHGNVWEWCIDSWDENYHKAPIDGSAWSGSHENSPRLLRGGSWVNYPAFCRSAYRGRLVAGLSYNIIGFRVVCAAA